MLIETNFASDFKGDSITIGYTNSSLTASDVSVRFIYPMLIESNLA